MTKTKLENPWHKLPMEPPYILAEDRERIRHYSNYLNLDLDTLPGQFAGGLDTAEVILLLLNPGFDVRDTTVNLQIPEFVEANRNNHIDPYSSSFYYFGGGLNKTAGYEWWVRKLKPLLQAGVSEATLRKKIMLVEYFPYHSRSYKDMPIIPSQLYAFELVRQAIVLEKTIVVMRKEKLWIEAVPELKNYAYMKVNSFLNPTLSPKNLGEKDFESLLSKLKPL